MSVIKKIGEFIIENSQSVELAAILVAAILLIVFITKAIADSKKKRQLLNEINETVSEINSNVTNLGSKKNDVIYIDNRCGENVPSEQITEQDSKNVEEALEQVETLEVSKPLEEENITKKFFERDCSVDKNGRVYSEEELIDQIKE